MEEQIKIYEEIARERHKARQHFLKDRQQQALKDELGAAQARPIVEPLVKAFEKTREAVEDDSMTAREIKEHVNKILRLNIGDLNRKEFLKRIRELYQNSRLFNVLLAMVRLGHINRFPIRKIVTTGPVDSLIFYGQGGSNLDYVIGVRQTPEFKMRLSGFNTFYKNHETIINGIFHEHGDLVDPEVDDSDSEDEFNQSMRRRAHEIMGEIEESIRRRSQPQQQFILSSDDESDDTPVAYVGDRDVSTFASGSGLEEQQKRLGTIHAQIEAGNTSLDIVNEAHDILKMLLKKGNIDKAKYRELEKLYD